MALDQLEQLIRWRLESYFYANGTAVNWNNIPMPYWNGHQDSFTQFLSEQKLNSQEYFVLLLALVPHIRPHFFDDLIEQVFKKAGDFPQLGGVRGKNHRGFLPTGETALFLLAGEHLTQRFAMQELFSEDHFFYQKKIITVETVAFGEPPWSGKLVLSQDYVELLTTGKIPPPRFSPTFPAKKITTTLDWKDAVLNTPNQRKPLGN